MRIDRRSRFLLRAESIALVLALLVVAGLAAWASGTWTYTADWTYGHRNSLTAASRKVLAKLAKPVTLTAFVRPGSDLAAFEHRLLERYRRADPSIRLRFVNPDLALAELRSLGINAAGEIYVSYGKRGEKVTEPGEAGITNALLRLARGRAVPIVFLTGHGEASPEGRRNYDLDRFAAALTRQGFAVSTRNLASSPGLPRGAALVVVAGPQEAYLPAEVAALEHWIAAGGSLLWLHNPGSTHGLAPVAAALGVRALPGTVVDTTGRRYGIKDARMLVVSGYGDSPVTHGFGLTTLFPDAGGFATVPSGGWKSHVFVHSHRFPASWLMAGGSGAGDVVYRPGTDTPGPVAIGITLSRPAPSGTGTQRAAVVADAEFLSDSFLGNGGNLDLGLRLINWLTDEGRFLDITPPQAPDRTLDLSRLEQGVIGLGFLAALPLALLALAAFVWLRRRRR